MGKHRAISKEKLAGGVLLGAVASGLAITALSSAGTARATCASISGVGNGGGCHSTPTSFAIGLGSNADATANGMFDGAIANGVTNTGNQFTNAISMGNFDFAYAGGPNTAAVAQGTLGVAVAQGSGVSAAAGFLPPDVGNVAFNIANEPTLNPGNNRVFAGGNAANPGIGNVATNLGGTSDPAAVRPSLVAAFGQGNVATNMGGAGNIVEAGDANGITTGFVRATLGTAFNVAGSDNTAIATGGPFAVAGTLGGTGKTALQNGRGSNIK